MLLTDDPQSRLQRGPLPGLGPVGPLGGAPAPRVLVVDGDPRLRETTGAALRDAGFAVRVVGDGLEALYALEQEPPDLVVLDLELPVVSGFRVLHLLKRPGEAPSPPVLVLTALSWEEAREAVNDGADDFATKPVTPAQLVTRARWLLHRRRRGASAAGEVPALARSDAVQPPPGRRASPGLAARR